MAPLKKRKPAVAICMFLAVQMIALCFLVRYVSRTHVISTGSKGQTLDDACSSDIKQTIDPRSDANKHNDKLSLIVGEEPFTAPFGEYCQDILGMEVIRKSLAIASSFWVMDNDAFEQHPNFEMNEIHAPFFTNKEYGYRYDVHHIDYIYLFVDRHALHLHQTLKLIEYADTVNVTCFVLITNLESDSASMRKVQSHLKHSNVHHIVFELRGVYLRHDTTSSRNHDVALLLHQLIRTQIALNLFVPKSAAFDILHFADIVGHVAVSPLYPHLYGLNTEFESSKCRVSKFKISGRQCF